MVAGIFHCKIRRDAMVVLVRTSAVLFSVVVAEFCRYGRLCFSTVKHSMLNKQA